MPSLLSSRKSNAAWKTMVCIPNMGYTDPLAYDNRLVWAYRMGLREERGRWADQAPDAVVEAVTGQSAAQARIEHRPRYEFYFATVGKILTPFAREMLADQALERGMDLVCMIDDDMVGDADSFFRLAHNVTAGPADLCGALAFTRGFPHIPVLYVSQTGFDRFDGSEHFQNHPIERYPRDQLVEVDAVGFGMVVFTVDLLKKMAPPRFMSTCGTGEDILFCYKAKKLGARIFSDTRVKLGHVGHPPLITEETYEQQAHFAGRRDRDGDERKYDAPEPALAWGELR